MYSEAAVMSPSILSFIITALIFSSTAFSLAALRASLLFPIRILKVLSKTGSAGFGV